MECDDTNFPSLDPSEFGDAKYITEEMLSDFCKRTMYLLSQVETLFDMTDPEICKRFSPPLINDDLSYGLVLDSVNKLYKFSDLTSYQFIEDLSNLNHIDTIQTDAMVDTGLKQITMVPQFSAVEKNIDCPGPWGAYTANAFWYVGYDRTKSFRCAPEWLADPLNADMPSVCRGLSFKAQKTGYLESIVLNLKGDANAEFDLYFEIRKMGTDGKPTGQVLATATLNHEKIHSPGLMAIPFKFGPLLTTGTTYAITIKSPFTSYDHHFGIGGWGANCKADPCPLADAWTSWDNGHSWMKHGKADNVPYKEGQYAPQDFAYIVYTRPTTPTYSTTVSNWVFFKPYKTNPVKTVYLSATTQIMAGSTAVTFYVSNDLKTWYELNEANGYSHTFDTPKTLTYIKASLSSSNSGMTPIIEGISVHMDTNPATEGYLRGEPYNPKLSLPLGACVWDKIDAPVTLDTGCTCLMDIIRNTEKIDRIQASVLPQGVENCSSLAGVSHNSGATVSITTDYVVVNGGKTIKVVTDGVNENSVDGPSSGKLKPNTLYEYRICAKTTVTPITFSIVGSDWATKYVSKPVGITPTNQVLTGTFRMGSLEDTVLWWFQVAGNTVATYLIGEIHISEVLQLSELPALPMIDMNINKGDGTYIQLVEGVDYTINPDTGAIVWSNVNMAYPGIIQATYYPVWLKGLSPSKFPLKCDLMEDDFVGNGVDKTFKLTALPVDPIRIVTVNGVLMHEFDDYSFNYQTNQLTFNLLPASGAVIVIKYTPDLQDTGLALAYHVTRPDTSKQVNIKGNSFEYRV